MQGISHPGAHLKLGSRKIILANHSHPYSLLLIGVLERDLAIFLVFRCVKPSEWLRLLLHVAYLPLLLRAFLSGAPKLLPGIGVVAARRKQISALSLLSGRPQHPPQHPQAASLLTWLGSVATLLDRSILAASPLLPLPVYAMLTSGSFGLGNSLKLQKLLEVGDSASG